MVVLTALGTLSMLTVLSVRGGIQTTANDRFHAIAQYAAESGGAAAMEFLRTSLDPNLGWTALVTPSNTPPLESPTGVLGNDIPAGDSGNPFSADLHASYRVELLNNRSDSGFLAGTDDDTRVIIRSTGYGPNGAVAIIEWDVKTAASMVQRPCTTYAQKGESEDNSGRNDCLGTIDTTQSASFRPE